ncbi:MAG: flagellar biosynthesis protein FlhA [Treponema sp.]|nr:flagellar biosynthesis protein FlhA [Treponema sp.]
MANERRGKILNFISSSYVGILVVAVLFALFMPLPKIFIDLCMVLNLAFAFIILLVVLYTPRASDFQTFPRIILFQTIFGLAVNVSSTRLILSGTPGNTSDQSVMVQAFANIVAGNNTVIGFIIFIIIVILQVIVITKGSTRVSEVAARFSLDSMQQKYFDIDNRLNSGVIDDTEALRLKNAITKEIDFYSNMDGASKFVSGNVKAGIFITVINLIGGFVIASMARSGMSATDILNTYSKLTIGDGLMSQLPSLVISFATGILVTGTKSDDGLGDQLKEDFTRSGYIYIIVGAVLIGMGLFLPGTRILLIPFGALFIFAGYRLSQAQGKKKVQEIKEAEAQKAVNQSSNQTEKDTKIQMLDDLSLELGYGLIPLVSKENGAELLERITRIRNEAKLDMGFIIPQIRILDNMTLAPNDYSFKIHGIEFGHAEIRIGYNLCIDTGSVVEPLKGEKTKDPTFGMDALWLPADRRQEAEDAGYMVIDPPTIIATHLTEIIRSNAKQLLGRKEVSKILDTVRESNSVLVDEVTGSAGLSLGIIEKVLQNLLEENVSIRNIVAILETMANFAGISKNPLDLTAKVREALGLQICLQYVDADDKKLRVLQLSQDLSEMVLNNAFFPPDGSKPTVNFDAVDRRKWIQSVSAAVASSQNKGYQPIILCVGQIRQLVKSALEKEMPGIIVLSHDEVYNAVNTKNFGVEVIGEINIQNEE